MLVSARKHRLIFQLSNILNARKSVLSGYPNTKKKIEKNETQPVFFTDFEVFSYLIKRSKECLI